MRLGGRTELKHSAGPLIAWSVVSILVVLAALLLYAPTLGYEFVWDDRALILDDMRIRSFDGLLRVWGSDFFQSSDDATLYGYYRPFITLSYALDLAIWRTRPFGFHLTNILMHGAISGCLVLLAKRIGIRPIAALCAGLLFAVHPMHTETVTWISGRTDLIATLAALPFLLTWNSETRWKRIFGLVTLTVAFLSKEVALVVPAVAILITPNGFKHWRHLIPAGVIAILYLLFRAVGVPMRPSFGAPFGAVSHVLSAIATPMMYLEWLAWPDFHTAYHQTPPIVSFFDPRFLGGFGLILLAIWGFFKAGQGGRIFVALLLTFGPMMNFVRVAAPFDMGFPMSERFVYLPSLVAALGIGYLVHRAFDVLPDSLHRHAWTGMVGRVATVVVALALVGLTASLAHKQNSVWENEVSFFEATQASTRDAPYIDWHLASVLRRAGRADEALPLVMTAMARNRERRAPINTGMVVTLTNLLAEKGEMTNAIRLVEERIEVEGDDSAILYYNLGVLQDHVGEKDKAEAAFVEATTRRTDFLTAWMANAALMLRSDRDAEAAKLFQTAMQIDPRHASAYYGYGLAMREQGQEEQARIAMLHALDLDPGPSTVDARIDVGVLIATKDPEKAITLLEQAVQLAPENYRAQLALDAALSNTESTDGAVP